ncbi:MAG: DUF4446 family protein [Chloroflexota bacterium]
MQTFFNHHAFLFWLALAALVVLVTIWTFATQRSLRRLQARVDGVFAEAGADNTARMLVEYLNTVRSTAKMVERIKAEHDQMAALMPSVVRHVGLVRFSPFHDTGGDQSFALAVLDGGSSGVIVTGLHSRHDSRLYVKPIEAGSSAYSLTPEEREAIQRALNGSTVEAVS